jgi:enterochelin esterase family protein
MALVSAGVAASGAACDRRVVHHDIQSAALAHNQMGIATTRHITVRLPDEYGRTTARYPVIYFLPGFGTNSVDRLTGRFDRAATAQSLPPAITVFIDLPDEIVFLNNAPFGRWEDYLIDEVIPFIDRTYRTIAMPEGRALTGHSTGGLSALLLPLRHPGVWSAIGMNDGSAYQAGYYELHAGGMEGAIPKELQYDYLAVMGGWRRLPARVSDYSALPSRPQQPRLLMQLGLALSPNPSAPLGFDPPIDKDGNPVPEALERWRAYCLFDPVTVSKYREAFSRLKRIVQIVPHLDGRTNAYQNIYWMQLMTAAGLKVQRIDMPGGHGDFGADRLVALEEAILPVLAR